MPLPENGERALASARPATHHVIAKRPTTSPRQCEAVTIPVIARGAGARRSNPLSLVFRDPDCFVTSLLAMTNGDDVGSKRGHAGTGSVRIKSEAGPRGRGDQLFWLGHAVRHRGLCDAPSAARGRPIDLQLRPEAALHAHRGRPDALILKRISARRQTVIRCSQRGGPAERGIHLGIGDLNAHIEIAYRVPVGAR